MRVTLRVITDPPEALVYINFKLKAGGYERLTAVVDTGAEHSMLPDFYMDTLKYELTERGTVEIERAGVQRFTGKEAKVWVYLEDEEGNRSPDFGCIVWFAAGQPILAGFGGILDRAILYLNTPNLNGYLEFAD